MDSNLRITSNVSKNIWTRLLAFSRKYTIVHNCSKFWHNTTKNSSKHRGWTKGFLNVVTMAKRFSNVARTFFKPSGLDGMIARTKQKWKILLNRWNTLNQSFHALFFRNGSPTKALRPYFQSGAFSDVLPTANPPRQTRREKSMAPYCSCYHYWTNSFNKAWNLIQCNFKSYLRVGDMRWWESLIMVPPGNKAKCLSLTNHSTKSVHHQFISSSMHRSWIQALLNKAV